MMDQDAVRAEVVRHLLEASDREVEADAVTDATSLREDLDLSSLQAVTLVMELEEGFGVTIEDEEIMGLKTVGDVLALVREKKAGGERVGEG